METNDAAAVKQKEADKALMKASLNEIRGLREHNNYMRGRLTMFDDVMSLFRNVPFGSNTMGASHPDVARELEMRIETFDAIEKM